MYFLSSNDDERRRIGTSVGQRKDEDDGTFLVGGWNITTISTVEVDGSYLLSDANGSKNRTVTIKEVGSTGKSTIRFKLNS